MPQNLFVVSTAGNALTGALAVGGLSAGTLTLSRTVLQNKPVAVIGASTGSFGAVWAQAELRKVLAHTGARVVDLDLPVAKADDAFDESGALHSAEFDLRCADVLAALVDSVEARHQPLAA